ncbi:MAG: sugar phosphate isomerase/epimerase [Clostridia bacterium]|nr:sugar phosphate isomerase/epimerase [Clostridia bacterium]
MKLGIIAPSHDENGVKRVADLGLKWIEFDINADDISYFNVDTVNSALDKYGVRTGAIGRWGRPRINKDGSINEKEQKDEFALIDACRKLDCPVYITGINYVEEISLYDNYSSAIKYLASLQEYGGEDVRVITYNCGWNNYIDKPAAWDIVNAHLGMGIKFDPSHTINGGRDYIDEAYRYGKLVGHIHLKGTVNIGGEHLDDPPAGLDMINWGMLLSIFQKYGYDAMLSIEPHSYTWAGELGERGLKYTIDYFRSMPFVTE